MDESGGSGQPRSGTDEATERHEGSQAPAGPAADATRPGADRHERPTGQPPADPNAPASDATRAHPEPTSRPEQHGTSDNGPGTDGDTSDGTTPPAAPAPGPGTRDGASGEAGPGAVSPPPAPHEPDRPTGTDTAHHRTLAQSGTGTGTDGGGGGRPKPPRRGREPGGGLLMGRPFGVPVYVAPSWFLVAALITWVFGGQLDRVLPELGALRYLVSLFFAVAFYASVLVHELAHTVAALRFKLPVRRIQLQFFGGVSEIEKEAETPGREFVLAFVGPLLSLVLSGLFYLAMLAVEPGTVPGVLLAGLMVSNLIVAAFNLLPGLPLDGGRMLRAVVWKITGRPMSGTIAAAWVGRALAVSVLIGLPLLTQSGALGETQDNIGGMDTVTDALLAAILAAIIWTGAGNSLRMARLREHLPELRARSLTRRAVPVETSTPLSEALRRANAAGARALVVVDANGEPVSLVREAAIVGVPEHRRPWVAVSGLAQDITDGMRVSAELAGEPLLDVLRATPATEYLVVEDSGEIYGVLSAADVERAFVKAMARPS
ncbi:site-2 protease family protein [Streptomyces sp. NBC_01571]|uniref:site-2 protease family protein n=1 Tax=Streptomyces sp. NBC_01571 TaxID=2975883 RepID=UPI00225AC9E6|nr:site-2 protease family protein [Streptomyces sp. NBC_01571]MCX4573901.1 site-2 protease family protein [Streptomyces sp. NBC_01571]